MVTSIPRLIKLVSQTDTATWVSGADLRLRDLLLALKLEAALSSCWVSILCSREMGCHPVDSWAGILRVSPASLGSKPMVRCEGLEAQL